MKDIGEAGDTAFVHVHVLPMNQETVLEDQLVLVGKDGKIKAVESSKAFQPAEGVTIIDGSGQYLMPGIAEMHAHIPVAQNGNDTMVKETLFLYLSNGITVIRGMLGNPYHLELKKQVADGTILSPRIYTSSPSLNGNSVPTPEEAIAKVTQYQKEGYDFLKIHPGIRLPVFEALSKTAKDVGITFSGHVPTPVGIRNAIDFKYASIDHIDGYLEGLVPESAGVHPDSNGLFGIRFTELADTGLIPELAQKTKAAGIAIVPTQSLLERWTSAATGAEMANEPEMKYMNGGTLFQWRQFKENTLSNPEYDPVRNALFINIRQQLLRAFLKQGVTLLLGSDAPQIFNVPGFSIQHEMQAMADAGIPNFVILQSGTVNPARFFNAEGQFGVVAPEASADLILLQENPLEDIQNMSKINGVMVRGQWMSREMIQTGLNAIASKYNQ